MLLLALAAQVTGDADDGAGMIEAVGTLTSDGTECTSFGECAGLIAAGEDIDYVGASGEINLNEPGDPTIANYAVAQWQEGELTLVSVTPIDLTEAG